MYCEWPVFRRCCLCLPLRRGVLVFGYINVILTILQLPVLYLVNVDSLQLMPSRAVYFEMPIIFSTVLCVLEIVANVLLIYGAHTKRTLFIKIYYYFTVSMLLAAVILEFISTFMSYNDGTWIVYFLFCLIINLYLLFIVRSLIFKLQVSNNNKFTNQLADFVDGAPLRHDGVYTEIVVPKDSEIV